MSIFYAIGVVIFGAALQQQWMMTIGFILFAGGIIWEASALLLEENNSSIEELFDNFLKERRNARVPPKPLRMEVENFATVAARVNDFNSRLSTLRSRVSQYPVLQRRLDQIARQVKIPEAVEKHSATLQRKLTAALKRDDYGTIIEDKRAEEIEYFLASMNLLASDEREIQQDIDLVNKQLIANRKRDKEQGFDASTAPQDGIAFEYWVAEQLEKYGWTTQVTKASGEQGCDIIAQIEKLRIGVQCKRYTANVGNTAVQQALGSISHYGLNKAVVITTSDYTQSAKELAASTGIMLLTHYDIPKLREKIDA